MDRINVYQMLLDNKEKEIETKQYIIDVISDDVLESHKYYLLNRNNKKLVKIRSLKKMIDLFSDMGYELKAIPIYIDGRIENQVENEFDDIAETISIEKDNFVMDNINPNVMFENKKFKLERKPNVHVAFFNKKIFDKFLKPVEQSEVEKIKSYFMKDKKHE